MAELTLTVDDDVAATLASDDARTWAGALLSAIVRARSTDPRLLTAAMDRLGTLAEAAGLQQADVADAIAAVRKARH